MILILDDHPLVRQGLFSLITQYKSDEEFLYAGTVKEAKNHVINNPVDLALIDVNLGSRTENGFDFLSWVRKNKLLIKIFVITASLRQNDFRRAQELCVDAYVLKDALIDEIIYGVKAVERGGKFYSATLVDHMNDIHEDEKALSMLTGREMEVLSLLGQGYSNKQISSVLFISEGTTKKHISSILNKLNLHNRIEAILLANKNSYNIQLAMSNAIRPDARTNAV